MNAIVLAAVLLAACAAAAPSARAAEARADASVNAAAYRRADDLYARRDQPGGVEAARAMLEKAIADSPLDTGLLWRYGRARVLQGERTAGWGRNEHFVSAEQTLQAAIDIDPDLVDARYWLAVARYRRGHFEDAIEVLNVALLHAPRDPRLHHLAGDILWRAPLRDGGDRGEAINEYQKALELSVGYASGYLSLAQAYAELGRSADAAAVLDRLDKQAGAKATLAADEREQLDALRRRLKL